MSRSTRGLGGSRAVMLRGFRKPWNLHREVHFGAMFRLVDVLIAGTVVTWKRRLGLRSVWNELIGVWRARSINFFYKREARFFQRYKICNVDHFKGPEVICCVQTCSKVDGTLSAASSSQN